MASAIAALKGQSAIVTGGGSGINLAFAKLLVETWIKSHERTNGGHGRAVFLRTDVRVWSQLERTFDECLAQFGKGASIVVPGAGIIDFSTNSFWEDCDTDDRYKILDVNLAHPIKMTRIGGTVLLISSLSGQLPGLATPLYVASKHGINGFVRSLGPLQQACGIRVLELLPGQLTKTPLLVDHPLTFSIYDPRTDMILPPEELARAMMALVVETEKYQA
ncbi:15-hydroxyprostaglandin dehydrogenase, partial [Penicillium herquei]